MNNLAMLSGNQASPLVPSRLSFLIALPPLFRDAHPIERVSLCFAAWQQLSSVLPFFNYWFPRAWERRVSSSSHIQCSFIFRLCQLQGGKEGLRKLVASAFAMWARVAAQSKEGGGGSIVRPGAKEKEGGLPAEIDVYCSDFKAGKQVMAIRSRFYNPCNAATESSMNSRTRGFVCDYFSSSCSCSSAILRARVRPCVIFVPQVARIVTEHWGKDESVTHVNLRFTEFLRERSLGVWLATPWPRPFLTSQPDSAPGFTRNSCMLQTLELAGLVSPDHRVVPPLVQASVEHGGFDGCGRDELGQIWALDNLDGSHRLGGVESCEQVNLQHYICGD